MDKVAKKKKRIERIKRSIRAKINGTTERPRLTVYRSNSNIYAQLVDDLQGQTLLASTSLSKAAEGEDKTNKIDNAKRIGKQLAEKALAAGISKVVFDRNGYLFHGRVKALAEGAREGGLQF